MKPTIVGQGTIWNYGPQGLTMTIGFAAMFLGVTLYTAAFIAEIVRGGILAVPKGQLEAASAIGLNRAQSLRQVILPQAFRVSLPPLGNQYLNLTKNTSLGIAVGLRRRGQRRQHRAQPDRSSPAGDRDLDDVLPVLLADDLGRRELVQRPYEDRGALT